MIAMHVEKAYGAMTKKRAYQAAHSASILTLNKLTLGQHQFTPLRSAIPVILNAQLALALTMINALAALKASSSKRQQVQSPMEVVLQRQEAPHQPLRPFTSRTQTLHLIPQETVHLASHLTNFKMPSRGLSS